MAKKTKNNGNFVRAAIPKLDGHCDHRVMLMENLLCSKEYWSIAENGVTALPIGATPEQIKIADENKLKDLKAKNYLFEAIDCGFIETILNRDSLKAIWDSMKKTHQGSTKVKRSELQVLRREFEVLVVKEEETITTKKNR